VPAVGTRAYEAAKAAAMIFVNRIQRGVHGAAPRQAILEQLKELGVRN
jgi:hypothetical protein